MCSNYEALRQRENYKKYFDVDAPAVDGKPNMWSRYQGNFICKPTATDLNDEAVPNREALVGRWALVPWRLEPTPEKIKAAMARSTFNARIESIEKKLHLWSCLDTRAKVHRPSRRFL